jgi:tetratricopeptide (TPR) repeat protein
MKRKALERPSGLGAFFSDDGGDDDNDLFVHTAAGHSSSSSSTCASSSSSAASERATQCREQGCELAEAGRMPEALKCFQEGLLFSPQDHLLLELSAQAFLTLDRPMQAVKAAEEAVHLVPDWSDGYLTLARAQRELGEVTVAEQTYRRVIAMDETNADAIAELNELQAIITHLMVEKGRLEQAVESSATADEVEANSAILHLASRYRVG